MSRKPGGPTGQDERGKTAGAYKTKQTSDIAFVDPDVNQVEEKMDKHCMTVLLKKRTKSWSCCTTTVLRGWWTWTHALCATRTTPSSVNIFIVQEPNEDSHRHKRGVCEWNIQKPKSRQPIYRNSEGVTTFLSFLACSELLMRT